MADIEVLRTMLTLVALLAAATQYSTLIRRRADTRRWRQSVESAALAGLVRVFALD